MRHRWQLQPRRESENKELEPSVGSGRDAQVLGPRLCTTRELSSSFSTSPFFTAVPTTPYCLHWVCFPHPYRLPSPHRHVSLWPLGKGTSNVPSKFISVWLGHRGCTILCPFNASVRVMGTEVEVEQSRWSRGCAVEPVLGRWVLPTPSPSVIPESCGLCFAHGTSLAPSVPTPDNTCVTRTLGTRIK